MTKKNILLFGLLSLLIFIASCGQKTPTGDKLNTEKITVYTTVYPLKYFSDIIGGKYVEAQSIYPAGSDAHTFEPTQKQLIEIANANLFFYVGLGLEGFANKVEQALQNEQVTIIATGEQLPKEDLLTSGGNNNEHIHNDIDPHIWLDPIISIKLANIIKNELIKVQPEHEQYFRANYEKIATKLTKLNDEFENTVMAAKGNKLLVAHAAYGYWANRYNFEQISISGLSTTNEPSQKQLETIVTTVRDNNLRYILFEQNNRPRIANIIQTETNTESLIIHNLSVLTEADIKNNDDYFTLMENNLQVLATALNN